MIRVFDNGFPGSRLEFTTLKYLLIILVYAFVCLMKAIVKVGGARLGVWAMYKITMETTSMTNQWELAGMILQFLLQSPTCELV